MDTLGALALATEPPHDGLMNRPPIGRGVGFITKAMWRNIAGQSIYQMVVLFLFNFAGKQILGIHGSDATDIINTFIFNTFVFCQVSPHITSFCDFFIMFLNSAKFLRKCNRDFIHQFFAFYCLFIKRK